MKQGGALLQSPRDTEPLQTMKSGILQSGMYDTFQNTYNIEYVCVQALTTVDTYAPMVHGHCYVQFNLVYASAYEIKMKFVIHQLIHTIYL